MSNMWSHSLPEFGISADLTVMRPRSKTLISLLRGDALPVDANTSTPDASPSPVDDRSSPASGMADVPKFDELQLIVGQMEELRADLEERARQMALEAVRESIALLLPELADRYLPEEISIEVLRLLVPTGPDLVVEAGQVLAPQLASLIDSDGAKTGRLQIRSIDAGKSASVNVSWPNGGARICTEERVRASLQLLEDYLARTG